MEFLRTKRVTEERGEKIEKPANKTDLANDGQVRYVNCDGKEHIGKELITTPLPKAKKQKEKKQQQQQQQQGPLTTRSRSILRLPNAATAENTAAVGAAVGNIR